MYDLRNQSKKQKIKISEAMTMKMNMKEWVSETIRAEKRSGSILSFPGIQITGHTSERMST